MIAPAWTVRTVLSPSQLTSLASILRCVLEDGSARERLMPFVFVLLERHALLLAQPDRVILQRVVSTWMQGKAKRARWAARYKRGLELPGIDHILGEAEQLGEVEHQAHASRETSAYDRSTSYS